MDVQKLSALQRDVLKEIGNIGTGHAVTSMSTFFKQRFDMRVPSVNIVTFDEMMTNIGGPERLIVAMLFRISGEAPGTVYFILSVEEAEFLVSELTGENFRLLQSESNNELTVSALKEIGNIMTGSYLSALSDFTRINMYSSVPYLSIDMAGAVLTAGLIEVSKTSDYAIVINTEITSNELNKGYLNGHFFFLPDPGTLPTFFSALGIHGYE